MDWFVPAWFGALVVDRKEGSSQAHRYFTGGQGHDRMGRTREAFGLTKVVEWSIFATCANEVRFSRSHSVRWDGMLRDELEKATAEGYAGTELTKSGKIEGVTGTTENR